MPSRSGTIATLLFGTVAFLGTGWLFYTYFWKTRQRKDNFEQRHIHPSPPASAANDSGDVLLEDVDSSDEEDEDEEEDNGGNESTQQQQQQEEEIKKELQEKFDTACRVASKLSAGSTAHHFSQAAEKFSEAIELAEKVSTGEKPYLF